MTLPCARPGLARAAARGASTDSPSTRSPNCSGRSGGPRTSAVIWSRCRARPADRRAAGDPDPAVPARRGRTGAGRAHRTAPAGSRCRRRAGRGRAATRRGPAWRLRPYATDTSGPWWVFSDFGSDVRPGPLAPDHVLGIGAASLTLAQADATAPGRPRARSRHRLRCAGAARVGLRDRGRRHRHQPRALRLAATTAELSGYRWDLRAGSLLEPVADETFDLIVANPPFVVSPGLDREHGGYDYRDSGLAGDAASATLDPRQCRTG